MLGSAIPHVQWYRGSLLEYIWHGRSPANVNLEEGHGDIASLCRPWSFQLIGNVSQVLKASNPLILVV